MQPRAAAGRILMVDADDTLWENNIYFERAIDQFIDFLRHSTLSAEQVRATLQEIERVNAAIHGYGSASFARNLGETYERLSDRDISADDLQVVMTFGERILDHPLDLLPGVEATLADLSSRNQLVLFTKGHPEEQRLKIDRSGLLPYFTHAEIVPEKREPAYQALVAARGADPEQTWMIGNSPKSDILPALAVGLGAVFIPHPHTWSLEQDEIEPHSRLLQVERFTDLLDHF